MSLFFRIKIWNHKNIVLCLPFVNVMGLFSHISTKEEILVQELFDKALRKSFDFEWQIPYFHLNGNWQLFPHKWWLRYGWDYVTIEQKWFNHESILCISFEIKKTSKISLIETWSFAKYALKICDWNSIFRTQPRGVRQHCYKKKAATVGQNGRLSALCNFFSFWLIKLWGTTY